MDIGAIVLGITNMVCFCFGKLKFCENLLFQNQRKHAQKYEQVELGIQPIGLNSWFGNPRNPYSKNTSRVAGGSSSGSAIAGN